MTRAVITGAGAICAFGRGTSALWNGLEASRCAIQRLGSVDCQGLPVKVGGEVPPRSLDGLEDEIRRSPAGRELLEKWILEDVRRDRKVDLGLAAALEAWNQAQGWEVGGTTCTSLALGLEQAFLPDFDPLDQDGHLDWSRESPGSSPGVRFRAPIDFTAKAIREVLGIHGPGVINVSACAAGGLAVAQAAAWVSRGVADRVLCGGADSMLNPLGLGGMARLGAPSPRPEVDACRPFDRRRDGLVIGEGAAMFVVESEESAMARGVRPLAIVCGWGSTQDGYRVTAPRPDGARAQAAMSRAIARARRRPDEVGYVNAHGTGTPLNDPAEARAIRAALGDSSESVPVSSIKGAVGHLMAAAGAIEVAASLLAFERNLLPGTANHLERDTECALDVIGEQPRQANVDLILSNSFGFGGQNVSVLLERWR